MAVATFDTLKFANTLKAAGVPDKQAEAQAAAFAEVVQLNFKELTTKDDLASVRADLERVAKAAKEDLDQAVRELKRDIADLRTEVKHELQAMQTKHQSDSLLVKWMLGATFTGIVAVIGLLARLLLSPAR